MSNGTGKFLSSSLGKKFVMGLTGFLLVAFMIVHLLENLSLYVDVDHGSAFIAWVEKLHLLGPFIWVLEFGLALLFGVHVWMALKLTAENRAARPTPYVMKKTFGESTLASRNMFVTGVLILGGLILHLIHFRFSKGLHAPAPADLFARVREVLANPIWAGFYVVFGILVGIHVSHGFRSAFQSFGANHPRINCCVRRCSVALGVILALGFASFPIMALISWR
ncbi:MAG: succinate dehydrogenase cytochrome b subunit [Planctomycetes bacterium]|nr:succinate dehydrogenase cytochrome b subunit [Planctomycetota bacterium]